MLRNPLQLALRSAFRGPFDAPSVSGFNFASLWPGSEAGLWLDIGLPQLFQDSADTTQTTLSQPSVGLGLDKRKDPAFVIVNDAVWTKTAGDGVLSVSGNQITVTGATTATFIQRTSGSIPLESGLARLFVTASYAGATGVQAWLRGAPKGLAAGVLKSFGVPLNDSDLERLDVGTGTVVFTIHELSYWRGNHLRQALAAARPVLSARVNLITKTEQFNDAVWTKTGVTVTADAVVAPDGTTTADLLTESASPGEHNVLSNGAPVANTATALSFYLKPNGRPYIRIDWLNSDSHYALFDLSGVGAVIGGAGSVAALPNGWFRCTLLHAPNSASIGYRLRFSTTNTGVGNTSYTGDGISGAYVWGGQLETGSAATKYQRVNTATDYDTAGFANSANFDGVDDGLATAAFKAGTLTSGMDLTMAVNRNTSAQFLIGFNPNNITADFFGVAESGLGSTATGGGAGSPTYFVNGVSVAATRGALHTALTVGAWHVLEVRNLDLSTWTMLGFGDYAGFRLNGSIGGNMVLCPAQTNAVRDQIRTAVSASVGLTL